MKEVKIVDKQKYLDENYPFEKAPKLADRKKCIHCGDTIVVGDYKVYMDEFGDEFICCPNTPQCNGTVIDWFNI